MVLIQRNNFDTKCTILERDLPVEDITTYLEILKEQYEAQGWHSVWDNRDIRMSLTLFRNRFESITFMPYYRRVPVRRNWFFF